MDVTTSTFTATQMILAWTLLGLLVSWLIIFAALSLRVFFMKNAECEAMLTPSRPLPAISTQPANTQLHYVEVATEDMRSKGTNSEAFRDSDTLPLK